MIYRLILVAALLLLAGLTHAKPKCEVDPFSGKQSCVYATGTIGLPGIGNQIITRDGQMVFRRMMMAQFDPLEARAFLFRIDNQRTVRLMGDNATRPAVNCSGQLCTWTWSVVAMMPADVLRELAAAKTLLVAVEGDEGKRTDPQTMKKGGQIFAKFLADVEASEPGVLGTSVGEAFLQVGDEVLPYTALPP